MLSLNSIRVSKGKIIGLRFNVNQSNDPDAKAPAYANYLPKSVCVFEENAPTASYQNDKELLRDIALLANSMMPLHTLQEMRNHMQPRARVKWDKYLQRAAEMTTKLENEYAAKLGPSPNIVPDLQFFRKPLEDVKNMHAVEPKDGKSDALSLDDSGEMVGQLTFDGEKKENPQDQSERLLSFGKSSENEISEYTDIPLDGASAYASFSELIENFMESASEKRVIDNNDPEGQQLYYEKIEKEHKDINELFEHCVSGDYDPELDRHIRMPSPAVGPREIPLGEGWRVSNGAEDAEEPVKYVKWYELEAALIYFEDQKGMNGIEDYGQEKVKKGLFDKDEKEQVLDHLIYKYQEPHNILLEIIKDKQSGTADKLISSKKFAEIEEKFRTLSPLAAEIPTEKLAADLAEGQNKDPQVASDEIFDSLRRQMRRRIEHDRVDAYLPFLYLIDYWRECLEVHPESFQLMLNTMSDQEKPIFEKNQHFALQQMVKKLYKRLPDVGAYFTTRLTIPPPTMEDSESTTESIDQLEAQYKIVKPTFSYSASIHYVMKAYPEFLHATRDTLLKDDAALKDQYMREMALFCEQYDKELENFDKNDTNDLKVKLLNTLTSTMPDGEFKEKVTEILNAYDKDHDAFDPPEPKIKDTELLGDINYGGEDGDDMINEMETNVEPNAEEWSNEYSLQDESESELDGQKLYSFLMKKLNPYFDDTKPFTPLPKNTDDDEDVDDKEITQWGGTKYEDEEEMIAALWGEAARKGLGGLLDLDHEAQKEGVKPGAQSITDASNEDNENDAMPSLPRSTLNVKSVTDFDEEDEGAYDLDNFIENDEEFNDAKVKEELDKIPFQRDEIDDIKVGSDLPLTPTKNEEDDDDQYAGNDALKPPPTVFKRIAIISFKLKQIYLSEVEMPLDASENPLDPEEDPHSHQKIHKTRIIDIPPRWLQEMKKVRWPDHSEELIEQVHHMPGRMVFEKELGDNDMIRKLSRQAALSENE